MPTYLVKYHPPSGDNRQETVEANSPFEAAVKYVETYGSDAAKGMASFIVRTNPNCFSVEAASGEGTG
jgi:hypothetical protein